MHYKDENGETVCGCQDAHREFTTILDNVRCSACRIIMNNRRRDLYFRDGCNITLIPKDWCDEFIDCDEDTGEREAYGYCATSTLPNSPVDTLWIKLSSLEHLVEVTEDEARKIHPALFARLSEINSGD
jgi:hypothetical protein